MPLLSKQGSKASTVIHSLLAGGTLVLFGFYIVSAYNTTLRNKQAHHLGELRSIARTAALQMDGDEIAALLARHEGDATASADDPVYQKYQAFLKGIQEANQLDSPLYTLSPSEAGLFSVGINSAESTSRRYPEGETPDLLPLDYQRGGVLPPRSGGQGTWLSAFEPIKDSEGRVVSALQVDRRFADFKADANKELKRHLAVGLVFFIIYFLVMNRMFRRTLNAERRREKAENEAMVKAKFLSTMSHEIRTPMNAIIGATNLLLQEDPRRDQAENLDILEFSSQTLLSLINDILDFSKLEADKITLENIPFDLAGLSDKICNSISFRAKDKGVRLLRRIPADLPACVLGDPLRLNQVLTNLLNNAIKFTPEGGEVELILLPKTLADGRVSVHFSVRDTGIGIPKDKQAEVFRSFSQADVSTTRKFGGTGLGLSISKKLLEKMGSEIHLESEPGVGSVFSFGVLFPVVDAPANRHKDDEAQGRPPTAAADPANLMGKRVLLVEDNQINVLIASKFLKKWGIVVDLAENGAVAVEKVKANVGGYDAVLMDIEMPVMNGLEATGIIRRMGNERMRKLPIIALSASAVLEVRDQADQAGMDDFVMKPFNPGELQAKLLDYV